MTLIGSADFPKISHIKKRAFLAAFSRCGSLSQAAKRAGVVTDAQLAKMTSSMIAVLVPAKKYLTAGGETIGVYGC